MHDRMGREMHQVAAIEKRNNLHAWRKKVRVEIGDLLVKRGEHRVAVGAFSKEYDSLHGVRIVHYDAVLAVYRFGDLPQPNSGALRDEADIAHEDRGPVLILENRLADI